MVSEKLAPTFSGTAGMGLNCGALWVGRNLGCWCWTATGAGGWEATWPVPLPVNSCNRASKSTGGVATTGALWNLGLDWGLGGSTWGTEGLDLWGCTPRDCSTSAMGSAGLGRILIGWGSTAGTAAAVGRAAGLGEALEGEERAGKAENTGELDSCLTGA